jgi:hypothetical protein
MKAQRESRGIAPLLPLTSTLYEGGWLMPRPGHFTPGNNQVPLFKRLDGPKSGLYRCGKFIPHRDSSPGPSSPQGVAIPTELFRVYRGGCLNFKHTIYDKRVIGTEEEKTTFREKRSRIKKLLKTLYRVIKTSLCT